MFPDKFEYLSSWFLRYKTYEGKTVNNYYMRDYMNISKRQVIDTIEETHQHWISELKNKNFEFPQDD